MEKEGAAPEMAEAAASESVPRCRSGRHEMTPANTAKGNRCKACMAESEARRNAADRVLAQELKAIEESHPSPEWWMTKGEVWRLKCAKKKAMQAAHKKRLMTNVRCAMGHRYAVCGREWRVNGKGMPVLLCGYCERLRRSKAYQDRLAAAEARRVADKESKRQAMLEGLAAVMKAEESNAAREAAEQAR